MTEDETKEERIEEGKREEENLVKELVEQANPEVRRYRRRGIIVSTIAFITIIGLIIWYWVSPGVEHSTSLLIGGLLF